MSPNLLTRLPSESDSGRSDSEVRQYSISIASFFSISDGGAMAHESTTSRYVV